MTKLEHALATMENHPLHRYMGVRKIHSANGESQIEITIDENAVNPRGAFHGGVAYTLCDMACYAALASVLEPNEDAATVDIHVSLLSTAQKGERIVTRGKLLRRGRKLAFMEAELRNADDKLLAKASVTKAIV